MFATRRNLYNFDSTNVNSAPDVAGVYRLYRSGRLIYIGKGQGLFSSIRSRLQSHYLGREGHCTQMADSFDYEICRNANVREIALLAEYRRIYGRLPDCNDRIG